MEGTAPGRSTWDSRTVGQQEFAKGKTRREQLEGESEGMKQRNLCEQDQEW